MDKTVHILSTSVVGISIRRLITFYLSFYEAYMKKLFLYGTLLIMSTILCMEESTDQMTVTDTIEIIQLSEENNYIPDNRIAFDGVTVFDRLRVDGQSLFYGPVSINGAQLPANQPTLSVTGTTLFDSTTIGSLGTIYGNTPSSPIQYVVINSSGMLGSMAHIGSSGTVTSVNGSTNITVTNPTTTPVVSLNPNITVTSITASGAISANSITANSATISGPLTATTATVSSASGDVGDLFTVGSGGLLSPAELVAGQGIIITPSAGTITIATSPLTIQCDTGSAVESDNTFTFIGSPAGSTVAFSGAGSTITLNVTDSNGNTAIGAGARATGLQDTAIGVQATATGGLSVAIGYNASATGPNSIAIGTNETSGSTILSIGTQSSPVACYIGGIYGTAGTGTAVYATSANQLVAPVSSRRYKENIVPLPNITNEVMQLHPVSFSYIKDGAHAKHLGFIAEEVEPLFPEMIVRDNEGKTDSVCSQFLTPLLVKTVQEHQNTLDVLAADCKQLVTEIQNIKKLVATLMINKK